MTKDLNIAAFFLPFTFRGKAYGGDFFIDCSDFPCLIFVLLKDKALIEEFGDDITIKTDGVDRLGKKDDYRELAALRQVLFDALKTTQALLSIKTELTFLKKSKKK